MSEFLAQQPPALWEQFLSWLSDPNVAYLLLVLGLLGLVAEVVTAGAVFPGVAGIILLVLALVGLRELPTNWAGVALIVAAVIMFLFDLQAPGHALSFGGAVAFVLGSFFVFTPFWMLTAPETPAARLSPWLIFLTGGGLVSFFVLATRAGLRAMHSPVAVGQETLVGRTGVTLTPLSPTGIVHIEGEEWSATPATPGQINAGIVVRIVGSDGLTLRVEPAQDTPVV